jgi:protein-S-isoprenylcysteine O-methyltransferase Ste14
MNILGIGPLLAIVGVGTTIAVIILERLTGSALPLPSPLRDWGFFAGIALLLVGVFFWISAGLQVKRAFESHQLATTGVFRLSRNPMYAGFILFIIPGIALVANDLLLIVVSVAMFVAFKARIKREEEFLAGAFGEQYEHYRNSVSQLVPFIRV